jgi:hypothetical protein
MGRSFEEGDSDRDRGYLELMGLRCRFEGSHSQLRMADEKLRPRVAVAKRCLCCEDGGTVATL